MPGIPPHTAFALARGTSAYPQLARSPRGVGTRPRVRSRSSYRSLLRPQTAPTSSGGC